jgi:hypothetical protein
MLIPAISRLDYVSASSGVRFCEVSLVFVYTIVRYDTGAINSKNFHQNMKADAQFEQHADRDSYISTEVNKTAADIMKN